MLSRNVTVNTLWWLIPPRGNDLGSWSRGTGQLYPWGRLHAPRVSVSLAYEGILDMLPPRR